VSAPPAQEPTESAPTPRPGDHQQPPAGEPTVVVAAPETPANDSSSDNAQAQDASQADPEIVLASAVDATGQREEAPAEEVEGELAETEEGVKLVRVIWTFLNEEPLQTEDPAAGEEVADMPEPAVAVVAAEVKAQGPLTIELVQEIDVTPEAAAIAAAAQANGQPKQMIEVTYSSAGLGGDMSDSSGSNRNFAFAMLAGAATLGVHWYRTSKRKLASTARSMFDPLGAWQDDPTYRED
jgi:hypothetical protein